MTFTQELDLAAQILRERGFVAEAEELHSRVHCAYTTSSELYGEIGSAIRRLQRCLGRRMPADAQSLLEGAMVEVRKVWPQL